MKKRILYNKKAQAVINSGINEMISAISDSYGPLGSLTAIYKGHDRSPQLTNDGATIANSIDLKGCNDVSVQLLKEVGNKVADTAGDGTSTAILLSGLLYKNAVKHMINSDINRNELISGFKKIAKISNNVIDENSKELSIKNIKQISESVSRDDQISLLLSKAYEKIGKNGIITTEDSNTEKSLLEIQNSATYEVKVENKAIFDNRNEVEIYNPYFLVTNEKVDNIRKLVPILTKISESGRCCLILSNGCSDEVCSVLLLNKNNGGLNVAPLTINIAKSDDNLKDISAITAAQYIDKVFQVDFRGLELSDLGECEKVVIKKEKMTIIKGKGDKSAIQCRVREIEKEKESYTSSAERDLVSNRLAKITGGTAVIKIGGYTESEVKEKKTRLEDAINAISSAMNGGIICGGGHIYFKLIDEIEKIKDELCEDEKMSVDIFVKSIREIYRLLLKNSDMNADVVMSKIEESPGIIYDLKKREYVGVNESGVIEPSLTIKIAIESAISVACSLIKSDAFIYSV